jgi:hypothetical protein
MHLSLHLTLVCCLAALILSHIEPSALPISVGLFRESFLFAIDCFRTCSTHSPRKPIADDVAKMDPSANSDPIVEIFRASHTQDLLLPQMLSRVPDTDLLSGYLDSIYHLIPGAAEKNVSALSALAQDVTCVLNETATYRQRETVYGVGKIQDRQALHVVFAELCQLTDPSTGKKSTWEKDTTATSASTLITIPEDDAVLATMSTETMKADTDRREGTNEAMSETSVDNESVSSMSCHEDHRLPRFRTGDGSDPLVRLARFLSEEMFKYLGIHTCSPDLSEHPATSTNFSTAPSQSSGGQRTGASRNKQNGRKRKKLQEGSESGASRDHDSVAGIGDSTSGARRFACPIWKSNQPDIDDTKCFGENGNGWGKPHRLKVVA